MGLHRVYSRNVLNGTVSCITPLACFGLINVSYIKLKYICIAYALLTLRYNLLFQDIKIRGLSVQLRAVLLITIRCFPKMAACVYSFFCCLCFFVFLIRSDMKKMQQSKSAENIQFLPFLTTCLKWVCVCVHQHLWAGTAAHLWALHLIHLLFPQ